MWREPSKENYIKCENGQQMWVITNDESDDTFLLFNGGFRVRLSAADRLRLINLLLGK